MQTKLIQYFIITLLNYSTLKVLHIAPSEMLQNQLAQGSHNQIVWRMSGDEGDAEIFFKVQDYFFKEDV